MAQLKKKGRLSKNQKLSHEKNFSSSLEVQSTQDQRLFFLAKDLGFSKHFEFAGKYKGSTNLAWCEGSAAFSSVYFYNLFDTGSL